MTDIAKYLDFTYLKTPEQAGISEAETRDKVRELTKEAIQYGFFAVMIRPEYVAEVRKIIDDAQSAVKLGTVIGFHEGSMHTDDKFLEAEKAIADGADELDFVINYEKFKQDGPKAVMHEFLKCTELAVRHNKIVKWIIEAAALTNEQIAALTSKISEWSEGNFGACLDKIFVKSSTGFYQTANGKPNGATPENIKIMLEHAGQLPVKAAGGVRTPEEARKMIELGVKRIGTSAAAALAGIAENKKEVKY